MAVAALAGALAACSAGAPTVSPVAVPVPTAAAYLSSAPDLTWFARAAIGSGVAGTLAGAGPYTVFAPSDAAFARMPAGATAALFRPENRVALVKLLTLHVIAGRFSAADLAARVAAGGGTATLATVEGESLTLSATQGYLTLTDADGNRSYIETPDIARANGIVHVVNGVLVPRLD